MGNKLIIKYRPLKPATRKESRRTATTPSKTKRA